MLVRRLHAGVSGSTSSSAAVARLGQPRRVVLRPVLAGSLRAFSDTTGGRGPPSDWDFSRWGDYYHPENRGDWSMKHGNFYKPQEVDPSGTKFQDREKNWREYSDPRMPLRNPNKFMKLPFAYVLFGGVFMGFQLLYMFISAFLDFDLIGILTPYARAEFEDMMYGDYGMERVEKDHRVVKYRVVDNHEEPNHMQMQRQW